MASFKSCLAASLLALLLLLSNVVPVGATGVNPLSLVNALTQMELGFTEPELSSLINELSQPIAGSLDPVVQRFEMITLFMDATYSRIGVPTVGALGLEHGLEVVDISPRSLVLVPSNSTVFEPRGMIELFTPGIVVQCGLVDQHVSPDWAFMMRCPSEESAFKNYLNGVLAAGYRFGVTTSTLQIGGRMHLGKYRCIKPSCSAPSAIQPAITTAIEVTKIISTVDTVVNQEPTPAIPIDDEATQIIAPRLYEYVDPRWTCEPLAASYVVTWNSLISFENQPRTSRIPGPNEPPRPSYSFPDVPYWVDDPFMATADCRLLWQDAFNSLAGTTAINVQVLNDPRWNPKQIPIPTSTPAKTTSRTRTKHSKTRARTGSKTKTAVAKTSVP